MNGNVNNIPKKMIQEPKSNAMMKEAALDQTGKSERTALGQAGRAGWPAPATIGGQAMGRRLATR